MSGVIPEGVKAGPGDEVVSWRPEFYTAGSLLRIAVIGGSTRFYVVADDSDLSVVELDGRAQAIKAGNESAGLSITAETVQEYLRFFCAFLDGEDDRFNIIGVPELLGEEEGRFRCGALVRYAGKMFNAVFTVRRDGMTEIIEDKPLGAVQ